MESPRPEESEPVRLARRAIESYIRGGASLDRLEIESIILKEPAACFVSLKKRGELRGCVGTILPTQDSLAEEIAANAVSAATQDPRFWPVEPEELSELSVSVDVLNPPEPIASREELDPKSYGVVVRSHERVGLLLPDIEGVATPEQQYVIACRKAGLDPDDPNIELSRFTVTRYH